MKVGKVIGWTVGAAVVGIVVYYFVATFISLFHMM